MSESPPIQWSVDKLSDRYDRTAFDCGKEPLNKFLQRYAGQNQRLGLSQTYAAVQPGTQIVDGYYTLSSGSVQFDKLPEVLRKGLPRYPVPVAHIGRLAVSKTMQGKGLGRALLLDAMRRVIRTAESIGILAIELWAKDEVAKSFYTKYGFLPLLDDTLHLYLPIKTVRKLGLV